MRTVGAERAENASPACKPGPVSAARRRASMPVARRGRAGRRGSCAQPTADTVPRAGWPRFTVGAQTLRRSRRSGAWDRIPDPENPPAALHAYGGPSEIRRRTGTGGGPVWRRRVRASRAPPAGPHRRCRTRTGPIVGPTVPVPARTASRHTESCRTACRSAPRTRLDLVLPRAAGFLPVANRVPAGFRASAPSRSVGFPPGAPGGPAPHPL